MKLEKRKSLKFPRSKKNRNNSNKVEKIRKKIRQKTEKINPGIISREKFASLGKNSGKKSMKLEKIRQNPEKFDKLEKIGTNSKH